MLDLRGPVAWSRGADVASSGPNRFVGLRRLVVPASLLLLLACSRSAPRADAFVSDSTGTDDRISCTDPSASGPDCAQPAVVAVRQRLAYIRFTASALLGLAGIAWFVRVRAEVRALARPAFLVMPRIDEGLLPIAGAEPDGAGLPRDLVRSGLVGDVGPPVVRNGVAPPLAAPAPARPLFAHHSRARTQEMALGPGFDGQPLLFSVGTARSAMEPVQAADATLQFLPGRLVHAAGGKRTDIRFVRQPGPATVVTLGRQEGPAGRHVQLVEPTVSRLHARMRYSGGRWTIGNLSQTNPLRVNGRALGSAAETHLLSDGDHVEVGELVLVFRER